jgi:superfamily II DNA or RNA helicase
VEIRFPRLDEGGQERLRAMVEAEPSLLAGLAAGELSAEFLSRLKREGIRLIPEHWSDMKRSCDCPDWGDPCKHEAAVYFVLAREIDSDPRTLFTLRGVDLGKLSGTFGAALNRRIPPPFAVETQPGDAPGEIPSEGPDFSAIPSCAHLILSLLPPSPPFCGRDFSVTLAEFYHHAARFTPWQVLGDEDEAGAALEHLWSRSEWTVEPLGATPGTMPTLQRQGLDGKKARMGVYDAFSYFLAFSSDDGTASYRFLFYLFRLVNLLCSSGAFIPAVLLEKTGLRIIWTPFFPLPPVRAALDDLARYAPPQLHAAGPRPRKGLSPRSIVDLLVSACISQWVCRSRFAPAGGGWDFRNLARLFFSGEVLDTASPVMRSLPLGIDRWLSALHTDFSAWRYRFVLRAPAPRSKEQSFSLGIDVLGIPPARRPAHVNAVMDDAVPLKDAAKTAGTIDVLRAPTALSNYLPEIRALFTRTRVTLKEERLAVFLDEASPLLARLGIEVVFPKKVRRELKPRLVLQAAPRTPGSGSLVSYLDMESLLDWKWQVAIGDEVLTEAEFQTLVAQKRALVKFRDTFIRIDPGELARLLRQARDTPKPPSAGFLKAHFAGESALTPEASSLMERFMEEKDFPPPADLAAPLRPYQARGYNWVCSLLLSGFGCILADDMGLGKTVQAIAALLRLREEGVLAGPSLIVAPAALLDNWERELARFAPTLKTGRYHGARRTLKTGVDVFLTTYQTAVRDEVKLKDAPFSLLIVDEAHLLKNADTRGARTIKALQSRYRLALSGTPVENRLEDLRSLFDFILPGYLGNPREFRDAFRTPIEVFRRKDAAEELRRITAPFLLRRLKTDRNVIADLPGKVTVNCYAALEKGQAALYESVVSEALKKSEKADDPAARSALILGLLTALKQICGHPRVYDKESPALSSLSGKARLLMTLLQEILAAREKTLVFSQYVETLSCLGTIIREELQEPPLIFHGGLSQKTRSALVDRFQRDPSARILLVSLRAGGLGLNLTAASRVIHYDLWYNPAVENQATDRAFRIGQTRNVFVHRLITRNSFEEKIDAMLASKRELAEMTVSSGESWLARMSHEELRALFDR